MSELSQIEAAKHALEHGARFPYDADDAWWNSADMPPQPAPDWAHAAARGILADLTDRRGVKNGFGEVSEDIRTEMVGAIASIIRVAATMATDDGAPLDRP